LDLAFEERYRDPAWMLELAQQAQEAADRIEKTPYGRGFLGDLQARAWAELANALRVNEQYEQAEEAFWKARSILETGTGDVLLEARINEVEASLWTGQQHDVKARRLLQEAHNAYLRAGDRHLAGRALIKAGISFRITGQPLEAVRVFRKALSLLDIAQDPKLVATANHDLLNALVDAGQLAEAGRLLFESNLREVFADDPQCLLRIRWVEGKLLARRGQHADAARVFREVRNGFRDQGLEYVAAVAGTDEAAMLLHLGRREEAHLLALDLSLTFHQKGMSAEAGRALRFLEAACRGQTATPDLAEKVGRFLDQAQRNSQLRFEAS
jgi:tetratricopeptide (TPR) repeat protein